MLNTIVHLPAHIQAAVNPDLAAFGDKVLSKKVLNWVADAEKNTPYLRTWYCLQLFMSFVGLGC